MRQGSWLQVSSGISAGRSAEHHTRESTVPTAPIDGSSLLRAELLTISAWLNRVERNGTPVTPAKPALREVAYALNISLINSNGNPLNTRQLSSQVIQVVRALSEASSTAQSPINEPDKYCVYAKETRQRFE